MRWLRASLARLGNLFREERLDRELKAELASHLEMHIADNLRAGMTPDAARRDALIKLGGIEQTKESIRDRRGIPALESLLQDLRFALRMLGRSRAFTVSTLTSAFRPGESSSRVCTFLPDNMSQPRASASFSIRLCRASPLFRELHLRRNRRQPHWRDPGGQTMSPFPENLMISTGQLRLRHAVRGYFQTLGLRLIHGRLLKHADIASARHVAIVNRTLVKLLASLAISEISDFSGLLSHRPSFLTRFQALAIETFWSEQW